jgi:hypothetical protein
LSDINVNISESEGRLAARNLDHDIQLGYEDKIRKIWVCLAKVWGAAETFIIKWNFTACSLNK